MVLANSMAQDGGKMFMVFDKVYNPALRSSPVLCIMDTLHTILTLLYEALIRRRQPRDVFRQVLYKRDQYNLSTGYHLGAKGIPRKSAASLERRYGVAFAKPTLLLAALLTTLVVVASRMSPWIQAFCCMYLISDTFESILNACASRLSDGPVVEKSMKLGADKVLDEEAPSSVNSEAPQVSGKTATLATDQICTAYTLFAFALQILVWHVQLSGLVMNSSNRRTPVDSETASMIGSQAGKVVASASWVIHILILIPPAAMLLAIHLAGFLVDGVLVLLPLRLILRRMLMRSEPLCTKIDFFKEIRDSFVDESPVAREIVIGYVTRTSQLFDWHVRDRVKNLTGDMFKWLEGSMGESMLDRLVADHSSLAECMILIGLCNFATSALIYLVRLSPIASRSKMLLLEWMRSQLAALFTLTNVGAGLVHLTLLFTESRGSSAIAGGTASTQYWVIGTFAIIDLTTMLSLYLLGRKLRPYWLYIVVGGLFSIVFVTILVSLSLRHELANYWGWSLPSEVDDMRYQLVALFVTFDLTFMLLGYLESLYGESRFSWRVVIVWGLFWATFFTFMLGFKERHELVKHLGWSRD